MANVLRVPQTAPAAGSPRRPWGDPGHHCDGRQVCASRREARACQRPGIGRVRRGQGGRGPPVCEWHVACRWLCRRLEEPEASGSPLRSPPGSGRPQAPPRAWSCLRQVPSYKRHRSPLHEPSRHLVNSPGQWPAAARWSPVQVMRPYLSSEEKVLNADGGTAALPPAPTRWAPALSGCRSRV